MKKREIYELYVTIKACNIGKLKDELKIKVVKLLVDLRPIVSEFEQAQKTAIESLQGTDFKEMQEKGVEINDAEKEGKKVDLILKRKVEKYFNDFQESVDKVLKPLNDKEVKAQIPSFSESEYLELVNSAELKAEQFEVLYTFLKPKK